MIPKIDPKAIVDSKIIPSTASSRINDGSEFESILKERLDISRPLEAMAIEFLRRTIEAFLSRAALEEDDPNIFPSPLLLNPINQTLKIELRAMGRAIPEALSSTPGNQSLLNEHEPPQVGNQPEPEVSNNLQGQQDFEHFQDFEEIVDEASRKYGVDEALIRAIIRVESSGDPYAVSPAGAKGLMQLMPKTAAELGVTDSFDPVQNIMAGTRYLRQLLMRYQGDVRLALAAYNWGMGNLEKRPDALPRETRNYIAKVENLYRIQTGSNPLALAKTS